MSFFSLTPSNLIITPDPRSPSLTLINPNKINIVGTDSIDLLSPISYTLTSPTYTLSTPSDTYSNDLAINSLIGQDYINNLTALKVKYGNENVKPVTLNDLTLKPVVTVPLAPHLNLDYNTDIHEQLSKYFYYRTLDDWLYNDLKGILTYLKFDGSKVKLLDSVKHLDSKISETQESAEKKIKYIEDNVLSVKNVKKVLRRFVETTGIHWADLPKHANEIRSVMRRYLRKKLEKIIDEKH